MGKIFFLLMAVLFLGCQTVPRGTTLMDRAGGIDSAVRSLVASQILPGKKVGVGDFVSSGGEVDRWGRAIANQLEVELAKVALQNKFSVINRQNFVQLAKEWELNLSGAVDSSTAKKVGSLLGIDVLLTGNLAATAEGVEVAAKGLDSESGKILWAERILIKKDKSEFPGVPKETAPLKEGEIKVRLWSDRTSYRLGEKMTLYFRADQDCYIALLDVGTSGKVHILYPNRFSGGGKVLAGRTYSIPGKDEGYAVTVGGPPGTEVVRAIATLTPIPFAPADFSGIPGVFRKVDDPATLTRDLNIVATKTEPTHRGEGLMRIEIRE